ncbi:MAG: 3-hydroxyisobutyryl-CoA hydrolase, partial [Betaproteobacteria bacterium]
FFSEEYALNHLIHTFGKPTFALMDGITMGGGMGLAQGASMRVVTEHAKLAMPETNIGLFPDVGGGWFLARTPGHLGEYLGLAGAVLGAADALAVDRADIGMAAGRLDAFVDALVQATAVDGVGALSAANAFAVDHGAPALAPQRAAIDRAFAEPTLAAIVVALQAEPGEFAAVLVQTLQQRSPLMMAVTLEQIRRARTMTLADDLRMERGLVRHCFHLRPGASETLEGIRALVVDKDQSPKWHPAAIADVDAAMVDAFFVSPWPAHAHPLRDLV